jgi:hypothetical protein
LALPFLKKKKKKKIVCRLSELKCNLFLLYGDHGKAYGFKGKKPKFWNKTTKKVSDFKNTSVVTQS